VSVSKGCAIVWPNLLLRKARRPKDMNHPMDRARRDPRGIVVRKVGAARAGSVAVHRKAATVAPAPMVQKAKEIEVRRDVVVRGANEARMVRRKGVVEVPDRMVMESAVRKVGVADVVPKEIVARKVATVPMARHLLMVRVRVVLMVHPGWMARHIRMVPAGRRVVLMVHPISSDLVVGPCHLRRASTSCSIGSIGTETIS
jgi:hypothetical protein